MDKIPRILFAVLIALLLSADVVALGDEVFCGTLDAADCDNGYCHPDLRV